MSYDRENAVYTADEKKYKPFSPWAAFGFFLLSEWPFIALIVSLAFIFAAKGNVNLRSLATGLLAYTLLRYALTFLSLRGL